MEGWAKQQLGAKGAHLTVARVIDRYTWGDWYLIDITEQWKQVHQYAWLSLRNRFLTNKSTSEKIAQKRIYFCKVQAHENTIIHCSRTATLWQTYKIKQGNGRWKFPVAFTLGEGVESTSKGVSYGDMHWSHNVPLHKRPFEHKIYFTVL